MEDRCRRNNIRIDGIKEAKGETWNDCEEKVQDMFAQKLGLDGIEIERANRVKRNSRDSNTNRPRTIVVKLLRFKDKTKIFQNANKLKGKNTFINNDFSKATLELRKYLMVEVKRLRELGYLSKILEFKKNAKKTWGVMKELIGKTRNTESSLPIKLVIEKKEVTEIKDIAEEFNNFFTNVGPNLAKKVPKFFKLIH